MKTLLIVLALWFTSVASQALEPQLAVQDYITLHHQASRLREPGWADTMRKLAAVGDGFSAEHVKPLLLKNPGEAESALIKSVIEATQKRAAAESDEAFVKAIQVRLERAAAVDLSCDELEGTLVQWVLKSIAENIKRPGVRAELGRIESKYVSASKEKSDYVSTNKEQPLFGDPTMRIKAYVRQITAAKSPEQVGGATTR